MSNNAASPDSDADPESRIARARDGDEGAQRELLQLVQRFARHVCNRLSSSWEAEFDAEDLAQESFSRLLTHGLGQYSAQGTAESYLYALVRTTMLMRVRSIERRRRREEATIPDSFASPTGDEDVETRLQVESILRRLDEACRELLRRVFLEEVPYPTLATDLGLAESSVRARVSRCVGKARDHD
jgi:RNA polymerase sigma factor (sigma-70 family)